MRLFLAVELDESARQAVAAEQDRLKRAVGEGHRSPLRWVRPEHVHLTLVFLGERADEAVRAIVDAMSRPVSIAPFTIGFGGLGVFPTRGAPRVLWLGVTRGSGELAAVRQVLVDRLSHAGIDATERTFRPHLTLARWRGGGRAERRIATDRGGDVLQVHAVHVTLIESQLSSTGPAYRALARARLEEQVRPPLQSEA